MVLEVFYKLLRDYEPQLEDFVDQFVELQGNYIFFSNQMSAIYTAAYLYEFYIYICYIQVKTICMFNLNLTFHFIVSLLVFQEKIRFY